MNISEKKVIVIGAGPAGLSCAYHLCKKKTSVTVFEAKEFIGGMSMSFDLWGQRVDLGPHRFFSKEKRVNIFFNELIDKDFTLVNRLTRIYYNKKYFYYPLKFSNVLRNLSFITIFKILWYYFLQIIFPTKDSKNFEEWVTNRFGKKLYLIFFKNYTEKLWGIPCKNIDADWAAQRIKTLSLFEVVKSAVFNNKGNKHKTLVDQFAYPKNGTGTLYEKASEFINYSEYGRVATNSPIKCVVLNKSNTKVVGIKLLDGTITKADWIVSTMPLTSLIKGFKNVPKKVLHACNQLYFRNTILIYLEVDAIDLFDDNWLYIHDSKVKHGRITNFRNWCPSLTKDKNTTILCMEFWCFEEDDLWNKDESSMAMIAEKELNEIGLIPQDVKIIKKKMIKVPKCYPVYEIGYKKHLDIISDYLKNIEGLLPIGRYGSYKYNNQDHSILMGILAANIIADDEHIDLWKINTDSEYQEDGNIKSL